MPLRLPTTINVKRIRGDTFAEVYKIRPIPTGMNAELTVGAFGTLTGIVDETAETMSFPVTDVDISNATAGTYPYKIVGEDAGLTRTLVQGSWVVENPGV